MIMPRPARRTEPPYRSARIALGDPMPEMIELLPEPAELAASLSDALLERCGGDDVSNRIATPEPGTLLSTPLAGDLSQIHDEGLELSVRQYGWGKRGHLLLRPSSH
jgi:hypothetical protein